MSEVMMSDAFADDASDAEPIAENTADNEPGIPADLTPEQQDELIDAIADLRKLKKNTKRTVHGWTLEWTLRARTKTGDLCAIDPRDGKKYHSKPAVQRKLKGERQRLSRASGEPSRTR